MVRYRSEFPSPDELVVCTVSKVFSQGAFVKLDEYGGKEGLIHISEVASGWIKNIREHIREGQKVVCKVLAVDEQKGHVDLSLRRVKENEKRWKREQWRREQRAEKLLELAARKLKKTLDEAYEEVGFAIQDKFGDLYSGLEALAREGKKVFDGLNVSKRWVNALAHVSSSLAELPTFKIYGYLELYSPAPDGVEKLRSAMMRARDSVSDGDVKVEISYMGSPRYRVEVAAPSYKEAEAAMQKVAELVINSLEADGGRGEFHAERKAGK